MSVFVLGEKQDIVEGQCIKQSCRTPEQREEVVTAGRAARSAEERGTLTQDSGRAAEKTFRNFSAKAGQAAADGQERRAHLVHIQSSASLMCSPTASSQECLFLVYCL